jgi:hypothetical protein
MDDQRILLDYETIKGAVAGEKWEMERILKHYDFYMDELATVKEREPDGNVKCYVDEVLKQAIALKLLEEAERRAKEKINSV